jgi:hypothetical protein
MTDEELQAIRARAEAATPGPWTEGVGKVAGGETRELVIGADGRTIIAMAYGGFGHPTPDCTREDRAFIAAARTDVPALLAEVDRLKAERMTEREAIEDALPAVFRFTRRESPLDLHVVYCVQQLVAEVDRLQRHSTCLQYVLADVNVNDVLGTRDAALAGGPAFEEAVTALLDEQRRYDRTSSAITSAGSCRTCGGPAPQATPDDPFCSDRCRNRWAATIP